MRLTLDSGFKKDLSNEEMATLDAKLRARIPELVGWSYSPLTGELTLDFGDAEEKMLAEKIEDWMRKADCTRKLRLEFMEMIKLWEE